MEIRKVPLSQIIPYENNPRRNDEAVDAVAESIRQCGYRARIIVDENMVIIAGHTRFEALKRLGWTEAEVQVETDMPEETKRKYRLLDNKTNELAGWDFEKLETELEGIDFDGFDFRFNVSGTLPPIPENLDSDDVQDDRIAVKFTFKNYTAYSEYEDDLKNIAEEMGAEYAVIKA